MENTIILSSGQSIEVLFCDEVSLDIDCSLRYIESGQKEIADYVKNIAKPRLDSVIVSAEDDMAAQIAQGISDAAQAASATASQTISEAVSEAKADITTYVAESITPEINAAKQMANDFASDAETNAVIAANSASAAAESEAHAATSSVNAAVSASAAANSAVEAADVAANLHIGFNLFDVKWSDHLQEDMAWLRADTFSWQSGEVYTAAYNELLEQYNDTASTDFADGAITGKLTPKGYRVVDVTQETAVLDLYNSTGIAWYYILDITNTRFKLPRVANPSLFEKYVSAPVKGTGMTLGLTDGGRFTGLGQGSASGTYFLMPTAANNLYGGNVGTGTGGSQNGLNNTTLIGITTDPSKSGMVTDFSSASVNSVVGYLYFYVGNFEKSAIAQTAGINSEIFNTKADADLSNIADNIDYVIESYQNGNSWYRLWKSGWLEQGGVTVKTGADYGNSSITLLKPYKDTLYQVLITPNYNNTSYAPLFLDKTVNGFKYYRVINTQGQANWFTQGYA